MKKKYYCKTFILISLLFFTFFSCKKTYDEGSNFSFRSKNNRLQGKWRIYDVEEYSNGVTNNVTEDYLSIKYQFSEGGQFTMTDDNNSSTGVWEFSPQMQHLNIEIDNEETSFRIVKLKYQELTLKSFTDSLGSYINFKFTRIY
jgi:hypothetical protein